MAAKDKDDDDSEPGDISFEELARKAEEAEQAAKKAAAAADDDDDAPEEDARDASTKGVAKALGVDKDASESVDADKDAATKEQAAVQNRAARRREEALAKRASRERSGEKASAKSAIVKRTPEGDDDAEADDAAEADVVAPARDTLPKDRNARAKELLKRRQESISGKSSSSIGLSAGEVVQDQVARAAAGTSKWVKSNFRYIVGAIVVSIGVVGGVLYYFDHEQKELGVASDTLIVAVESEYGHVFNDENKDPRPPEQVQFDPKPVFASHAARRDSAIASYDKVIAAHPGSGSAILAKLGKAGVLLDGGKYDEAYSAYDDVAKSELAKADIDVRARTVEGKGFALEGKKDNDAAMSAFRELGNVDKTYEDLSSYHQARIHLKKGENDKAKELLVPLSKKLEVAFDTKDLSGGLQNQHLRLLVEQYMMVIDPLAPKRRRQFGGANRQPSEAERMELIKRMMEQQQQHGGEHGEEEMPFPIELPEGDHDDGAR